MLHPVRLVLMYVVLMALLVTALSVASRAGSSIYLSNTVCSWLWVYVVLTSLAWLAVLWREHQQLVLRQGQLINDAVHDALTKLTNRRAFIDRLEAALHRARRNRTRVGLAFIDLDGFKSVNDIHGHGAGDLLLIEVAQRLMQTARKGDLVARIGGDEFVVLVEPDKNEGCEMLAKRLISAFRAPFELDGKRLDVTLSVGLAFYPDHGLEANDLMSAADAAMYRVKKGGRNGYALAEAVLPEQSGADQSAESLVEEKVVK